MTDRVPSDAEGGNRQKCLCTGLGPSSAEWAINPMTTGLQRIRYWIEPNFVAETSSTSPEGIMTFHTGIGRVIVDHAVAAAVPANQRGLSPRLDSLGCEWTGPSRVGPL
jgi:hypothetical protein